MVVGLGNVWLKSRAKFTFNLAESALIFLKFLGKALPYSIIRASALGLLLSQTFLSPNIFKSPNTSSKVLEATRLAIAWLQAFRLLCFHLYFR